jgi:hypothetical protein
MTPLSLHISSFFYFAFIVSEFPHSAAGISCTLNINNSAIVSVTEA